VNKTKKITNIHDYSKEVDKIIATGKPMVEQFMDLMSLMDVTFIDSKLGARNNLVTSSIKRPKKQDSSVQDKQTSDCCGAKVLTVQGYPKDEGTHYWQCVKCGRPCDIMIKQKIDLEEKIENYKTIELTRGYSTKVDIDDYDKLIKHKWYTDGGTKGCFQVKSLINGKRVFMARLITKCPKGLVVDHINHDPFDNRRKNLRVCTQEQNRMNTKIHKDNKCGYKGVYQDKRTGHWTAKVGLRKKSYWLGTFGDAISAAKAYDLKARELFGEFASLNFEDQSGSQTKRKRDATTGSTAEVHLNVFGIGGKIDRFFLSGDDITLYKIKRFIRKLFLDILKHNQDPMTSFYDYDGIAQEVIDLVKKHA